MNTIDQLFIDLVQKNQFLENVDIPIRDKKILISLHKQVTGGNFFTKNQGNLLLKIMIENQNIFLNFLGKDFDLIKNPLWSKSFRVLQVVKKIYTKQNELNYFFVEFTHNSRIQNSFTELTKSIQGNVINKSNRLFSIPFTEKNIKLVLDKLRPYKFEISESLVDFYNQINNIINKSFSVNEIDCILNPIILNCLKQELGDNIDNQLLLLDRRIKYQYRYNFENTDMSLTFKLANRLKAKIWISPQDQTIENILKSLCDLKRFPLLMILDGHNSLRSLEAIKNLNIAVNSLLDKEKIRVYFRFDNNKDTNIMFNKYITEHNLNQRLDKNSLIVAIANNQLPKFILRSDWYPNSVVSYTNSFTSSKTSKWCSSVDLQIYYNTIEPIIGSISGTNDAIM